jgi:uncharacterized protein (DUF697 family)
LQNPEFGYYFLRLTSDRLLQNHARLEGLVEQSKAALTAANSTSGVNLSKSHQSNLASSRAAAVTIDKVRAIGSGAAQRLKIATGSAGFTDNVVELVPRWKARVAAIMRRFPSSEAANITASRRRRLAIAVVERHANYSALGAFIPLPIANMTAVTAVIMRMVRELNYLYGTPLEHDRAYAMAIGMMGGVMPTGLAKLTTSTIASLVPGYNLIGLAVSSIAASAYARSVGRMLIDHLERLVEYEEDRFTLRTMRRWRRIWRIRLARNGHATRQGSKVA